MSLAAREAGNDGYKWVALSWSQSGVSGIFSGAYASITWASSSTPRLRLHSPSTGSPEPEGRHGLSSAGGAGCGSCLPCRQLRGHHHRCFSQESARDGALPLAHRPGRRRCEPMPPRGGPWRARWTTAWRWWTVVLLSPSASLVRYSYWGPPAGGGRVPSWRAGWTGRGASRTAGGSRLSRLDVGSGQPRKPALKEDAEGQPLVRPRCAAPQRLDGGVQARRGLFQGPRIERAGATARQLEAALPATV